MTAIGTASVRPGTATRSTVAPGDPELAAALGRALGAASDDVSVARFDRVVAGVDASHFLLTPQAVVTARSTEQVSAAFRFAREHGRHVTLRSGGTSLSGQASGADLLLDTREAFRRIRVEAGGARVRVQPGATVRQVNARLLRHGRKLGPDPASEIACTIGGVVANNSSGMACGIVHNTYRTLELAAVRAAERHGRRHRARPMPTSGCARCEPELHAGLARLRDRVRGDPALGRPRSSGCSRSRTPWATALNSLPRLRRAGRHPRAPHGRQRGHARRSSPRPTFRTVPIAPAVATALLIFADLAPPPASCRRWSAPARATLELMDAARLASVQPDPRADEHRRRARGRRARGPARRVPGSRRPRRSTTQSPGRRASADLPASTGRSR